MLKLRNFKILPFYKFGYKNISYLKQFYRKINGIDLKPEEFITIAQEFKTEIKNENLNRAVEVLGKYNVKTLNKIFEYNNSLASIGINTIDRKKENGENKKEEEFKQMKNKFKDSYKTFFTEEEINFINEISLEKDKLIEYLRTNSLSLDSIVLKNNYALSLNLKGIRKENKLIYFILALIVLVLSYDVKGSIKCIYYIILFVNIFFFYLFFFKYIYLVFSQYFKLNLENFDYKTMSFISSDKEEDKIKESQMGTSEDSQIPKSLNKFKLAKNLSERLNDVKGIDEVRSEIEEIVLMLKNPAQYEDVGAKLIRGILLIGKPGTGKTLLARALAGESGVNFIYVNASEFDKSLVGAGSKMLKEMFGFAKINQPCIIFIDEIDTLLHKGRRSGKYSSTYERGLINTFLSEMDGFNKREHIFVLGATNSEKDLDSAALRPGRFDKIVHVPLPDSTGRREIFEYYLDKIKMPIADDVSSSKLSGITPGFSGAEIENMVNLAIIEAVDGQKETITKDEFENSRDRVVLGIKRKSRNISDRVLLQTAIHEAGHTLVCFKDKICNKSIHKVTIMPRGESKGSTSTFQDDNFQGSKEDFIALIDMSIAGILAEELYFGENKIGTGCGRDLERASRIAKQMVQKFAMNNKFGYMVVDEGQYLHHRISDNTRNEMDESVGMILNTRSEIIKNILMNDISELKSLAQNLVEYGELDRDDIDNIFCGKKVEKAEDKKLRNVIIDNIPI